MKNSRKVRPYYPELLQNSESVSMENQRLRSKLKDALKVFDDFKNKQKSV